MFQVAVYGTNDLSQAIKEIIENQYNNVSSSSGGEMLNVRAIPLIYVLGK